MKKTAKRMLACLLAVVMALCAVPMNGGVLTAGATDIPSDAVEFNGHYYKVYDQSLNWSAAKSYCEDLGGHMVTITSAEEQSFLIKLTNSSSKRNMWIGAYPCDGIMKWITEEEFNYTNWASGEPNNVFNMQNAVMMYTHRASFPAGTWNDENGNGRDWTGYELSNFGFICEWEDEEQFHNGYDFNTDRWSFQNQSTEIQKSKYYILFGVENGNKIYNQYHDDGTEGQCYGMASTTASINAHDNLLHSFGQQNLVDVNLNDKSDMIGMTAADFIQYGQLAQYDIEHYNNLDQLYELVKEYINGKSVPIVVDIHGPYNGGTAGHALYVVGIKEDNDSRCVLLVDDSNYRGFDKNCPLQLKELILLKSDGKISGWRYHMWDGLDWGEDSNKNINYSYPAELMYQIGLAFKDKWGFLTRSTVENNYGILANDKNLFVIDSASLTVSCGNKFVNIENNIAEENDLIYELNDINNPEAFEGFYWIKSKDSVTFSNINDDSTISLSDADSGIEVSVPKGATLKAEVSEDNNDNAEILINKNEAVTIDFQNADGSDNLLSLTVSGTASADTITAAHTETGLIVTGISDGTVTLSKDDEIVETQTIGNATSEIEITYDKTGESDEVSLDYEHNHEDKDADGKCDICGETMEAVKNCNHICHRTGFAGFIWKILCAFCKLFGIYQYCECGVRHY